MGLNGQNEVKMRANCGTGAVAKIGLLAAAAWMAFSPGTARAQQAGQQTAQQAVEPAPALTLKQAVSLALRNSRDLSLARLQLQVSLRETGATRSQFMPNLYAGSGAAYSNGFPLAAGSGAPSIFSITYQESLFDPLA